MNPDTNKFEELSEQDDVFKKMIEDAGKESEFQEHLLRPNGEPAPKHWSIFAVGEMIAIKNYTFKVAHIGESHILFEPVGIVMESDKYKNDEATKD